MTIEELKILRGSGFDASLETLAQLGDHMDADKKIVYDIDDFEEQFKKLDAITNAIKGIEISYGKNVFAENTNYGNPEIKNKILKGLDDARAFILLHNEIAEDDKAIVAEMNYSARNRTDKESAEKVSLSILENEDKRNIHNRYLNYIENVTYQGLNETELGDAIHKARYFDACEFDATKIAIFEKYASLSLARVENWFASRKRQVPWFATSKFIGPISL